MGAGKAKRFVDHHCTRLDRLPKSDVTLAVRRAFNEGCDARIRGLSLVANSYQSSVDGNCRGHTNSLYKAWRDGWTSVDVGWGKDVQGRWFVTPIPHQSI